MDIKNYVGKWLKFNNIFTKNLVFKKEEEDMKLFFQKLMGVKVFLAPTFFSIFP